MMKILEMLKEAVQLKSNIVYVYTVQWQDKLKPWSNCAVILEEYELESKIEQSQLRSNKISLSSLMNSV